MRNSISCEIPPPPPPPHLIAAISRNSLNSVSSFGGDAHRSYFSFSSHRHHHRKEARPSPLKHNANSYHIYDDYPRYSLPIRHEKKTRTRHNTRRKRKKDEKTPPPRPPKLNTKISNFKHRKSDRYADKLRSIEIEYEYDTDEYNEGARNYTEKKYHRSRNIKRINDDDISSHILMNNMREIQHEMISHFERLRDGDLNGTNPFKEKEKEKEIKQSKHERIASFASSMNHHLEHYHEEEDLEIFDVNKRVYNDKNEDKLDLDDDDDQISPIKNKLKRKRKKKRKLHHKTRSKSMSSIVNGVFKYQYHEEDAIKIRKTKKKKTKCKKRKHKKHKNKKRKHLKALKEKIKHLHIDLNAEFMIPDLKNKTNKKRKRIKNKENNIILPIKYSTIPIPPKPKKINQKIDVI